jgi:hypothetical protein
MAAAGSHPEQAPAQRREASHRAAGPSSSFLPLSLICVICAICAWWLGCAAQSPPRPPRVQRPEAVKDLFATQIGTAAELRFTVPDTATDGQGLTRPLEIEIFRTLTRPGEKTALATNSAPIATLQGADLARHTSARKLEYRDAFDRAGFQGLIGGTLMYQVRGLTRGFRGRPLESAPSNTARLRLLDVPQPPSGVAVEPTPSALQLRWSAPTETVTGKAVGSVDRYRVYRSETGKPGSYQSIGESPETSFSDASFEFGRLYSYRVRALVSEAGETAASADSASVEIVPRDVFPPAAPAGLTGLSTANGVELIWSPNPEPDLAGYNIYRIGPDGKPAKLNSELLRSPLYRDAAVTSGTRYTYRVTAVDKSGNESAPSAEVAVEVP